MEKQFDIVSVCQPIMDYAVAINRLPETDGISRMQSHLFQSGGNAPSAITAAARLGAKCGVIGTVGSDPFGDFCRQDMIYHGVDVSLTNTGDYDVSSAELVVLFFDASGNCADAQDTGMGIENGSGPIGPGDTAVPLFGKELVTPADFDRYEIYYFGVQERE